jgi:hypothetical protein
MQTLKISQYKKSPKLFSCERSVSEKMIKSYIIASEELINFDNLTKT